MMRKLLSLLLIFIAITVIVVGLSLRLQPGQSQLGVFLIIGAAIIGVAAFISGFNDLIELYNKILALLGKAPQTHADTPPVTIEPRLAQRNRHTMLLKVKNFWIDGVLANSLHSHIIRLDMEHKPDAVARPRLMDILWQSKDQQPQPVPPGTKLITLFNHAAGDALLILGDPGSGKTTLLLELARDLLAWADQNDTHRIPVIFNLSTWATHQPPLPDWLINELQTLYLIPKKTATAWVDQDDILPLLDGLDEVTPEHRAACIQAINTYRQAKGTPLVVSSRIADYEAIGSKLHLSDALLLKSLTPAQIDDYLASGGRALDGVRLALQQDDTLQEMAQSPLLLSIMALTYRDHPPEHFTTTNPDDRRRQLFTTYIQRQLPQRQKDPAEDPATTLRQLTYLAHQMTTRDQTIFLIERLQPTWLPTPAQQRRYRWTSTLIVSLSVGLIFGLSGGLIFGLSGGLVLGLSVGLVLGRAIMGAWQYDIRPVEKMRLLWSPIIFCIIIGLIVVLVTKLNLIHPMFSESSEFNGIMILFILFVGLLLGLINESVKLKTVQNQGIINSLQNAIRLELVVGLVSGLVMWLSSSLKRVLLGLALGQVLVLLSGGGLPAIQHYTLRFWLHRYGYLPWKLVPFLDLAAERLILQKVGGGYRFIHRTLQDYLATLYTPPPS